jgi:hypothetical protein
MASSTFSVCNNLVFYTVLQMMAFFSLGLVVVSTLTFVLSTFPGISSTNQI